MRTLGIFAKIFVRDTIEDTLAAVNSYGFSAIQFNMSCLGLLPMPEYIPIETLHATKAAMDDLDLQMAGLSATFNMGHPDRKVRLEGLRRLEILAAASAPLGNHLLTLCTGTRDPRDKWNYHPDNSGVSAWLDMSRTMERAIEIAEEHDLYLGIEPELTNIVADPAKAQQLLHEMGGDRLRIILDPANLFERASVKEIKYRIAEAIDKLGPFIMMTHAKDRTADGCFTAPGQGVVPFAFLLQQLEQAGIKVPLVAHGFTEAEVLAVAHFLKNV